MNRRFSAVTRWALGLLSLLVFVPLTACDPVEPTWESITDTVNLYSLARPEYIDRASAFDFYNRGLVVVEQPLESDPTNFDLAFSEVDDQPVFLPAGVFALFRIDPGIATISSNTSFEDLARAPDDGYVTDEPVPVRAGGLYVIRTREDAQGCSRYGKFEVLEVDPQGMVTFRQLRNLLCNDRGLVPTAED